MGWVKIHFRLNHVIEHVQCVQCSKTIPFSHTSALSKYTDTVNSTHGNESPSTPVVSVLLCRPVPVLLVPMVFHIGTGYVCMNSVGW